MEVLGSLIKLRSNNSLPLPWWHRAPLGFIHGTTIHMALVKNKSRQEPTVDLILSVLDPTKWKYVIRVDVWGNDRPGFISKVYDSVFPLNIAITETVTLETGEKHHITLICEPKDNAAIKGMQPLEYIERERKRITDKLALYPGIFAPKIKQFFEESLDEVWHKRVVVEHGWIQNSDWLKKLNDLYPDINQKIDLTMAVVSADTTKRLMRYIFPYKGAILINVQHADEPGVLRDITKALRKSNLNILSSFLRRGGVPYGDAEFVAVCESSERKSQKDFEFQIRDEIKSLPPEHRTDLKKISDGLPITKSMIHPRHPDDFIITIPEEISYGLKKYKNKIHDGKIPIFISKRFINDDDRLQKISQTICSTLEQEDYCPIIAVPESTKSSSSREQIYTPMWYCHAVIVIVASTDQGRAFGLNQAHEVGFFEGQNKPVLYLVQDKNKGDIYGKFSNANDHIKLTFPDDERAFNPEYSDSISQIILRWLKGIKLDLTW